MQWLRDANVNSRLLVRLRLQATKVGSSRGIGCLMSSADVALTIDYDCLLCKTFQSCPCVSGEFGTAGSAFRR
jgi:hypothetical protein